MKAADLLRTAFLNLWRRKLRAFLTVLGMVIGVSSILVMVSLGIGIRQATIEAFAGTGSLTTIQVSSYSYRENENGVGTSRQVTLNKKSVDSFKKIEGVSYVMPMVTAWGMIKSGRYTAGLSILGITEESAKAFDIQLSEGELPAGKRGNTYEIVFGSYTLMDFYDPDSGRQAIDKDGNPKLDMNDRYVMSFDYNNFYPRQVLDDGSAADTTPPGKMYQVRPVGKMSEENNQYSWYCLMNLSALEQLIKENRAYLGKDVGSKYDQVLVKCASIDDVKPVKEQIEALGYGTYSLQDAVEMAQESTKRVQYLLGAIGGVALLVAAIGIMNTMMMSIFERTREIGIIKVLGCRMGNIAALFLAEAAFIGLFGGGLGLGLSYGISGLLNLALASAGLKSIIPFTLAIGAVLFSIFVALLAGLYPAVRAMKLSPLAAIRNE